MCWRVEPERIVECAINMLSVSNEWKNPFGDGKAGEKIRRVMMMIGRE